MRHNLYIIKRGKQYLYDDYGMMYLKDNPAGAELLEYEHALEVMEDLTDEYSNLRIVSVSLIEIQ